MRFEQGECHFDGVEVGTVGRLEQDSACCLAHRLFRFDILVGSKIIQNDDGSG